MTQVYIAAGSHHATTSRYRGLHLQEQLTALGITATYAEWHQDDDARPEIAAGCDVLILQRVAMSQPLGRLISALHLQNKPVVFDTDDLVFEPALSHWHRGVKMLSLREQELYDEGIQRYLATLTACDAVMTSTPLLAELARRRGKRAFVHRNALGAEMLHLASQLYQLRQQQPRANPVVIGYGSGTPTHDVDLEEAVPALCHIMNQHPEVQLWLAGPLTMPAALAAFGPRIRRFTLTDWVGWFELASQFDINLAPLERNNIFCRAKSAIKFIEAAALGVPTVATHIDAFADAIAPEQNGLLAGGPAEWTTTLERLVCDANLRRTLGDAARATVLARDTTAQRVPELEQIWPELARRTTRPISAPARLPSTMENQAPSFTPLTVNWLVTEPIAGSGGHMNIFRMVKHLVEFGHECHLYILPVIRMHNWTPNQLRTHVDSQFLPTGAHFHQWSGHVQPADLTIATYWKTIRDLVKLPNPGRTYYFVQDFEPYFYPMGSEYLEAENTYRMGVPCITLGSWLANLIRTTYGTPADPFDFAVDNSIYRPLPRPVGADKLRVCFYARPSTPRRGYELGIKALEIVKARHPNVEIILYGSEKLPPPPFVYTHLGILNQHELATLYASCDAGLVMSLSNPSLVLFEMMACRCAVVDIHSERVAGILEDGKNALLTEPVPEAIADAILRLLYDPALRSRIVDDAERWVQPLSWEHSARQIEAILLRDAPPPAERHIHQQLQFDETEALIWQIQQVLAKDGERGDEADQLRTLLYAALADKARMAQHVRRIEETYLAGRRRVPAATLHTAGQFLVDKVLDGTPGWVLGATPLSKLALSHVPFQQSFQADRSHLCRIELLFAARHTVHAGIMRFALYEGDIGGRLVTATLIHAVDVTPDRPHAIDFPVEEGSFGTRYTFTLAAAEADQQPFAVWHFWLTQHDGAALRQGGQLRQGELAFQPLFRERTTLQPPRHGPAAWGTPIRLAPQAARDTVRRGVQELLRLKTEAQTALQSQGVTGLAREISSYLEWQLRKGEQE